MSNYTEMLLSRVIDQGDITAISRYGIEEAHLETKGEKAALQFIRKYAAENGGQTPSPEVLAANVADFTYLPQINDSYEYLAKKIKDKSGKQQLLKLFEGHYDDKKDKFIESDFSKRFEEMSTESFIEWLQNETQSIKIDTNTSSEIGVNLKTDSSLFMDEYKRRKAGDSFKLWRSKFPTINNEVGGYLSGNMYTWYGRSGRGKSVFTMEEALEAATQGARVLVWAMEMSRFEWMARAYSSLSARQGIIDATIEGVNYDVGFENRALLTGKLSEEFESGFEVFLLSLNETLKGEIILRAADDADFHKRDVAQLESDIRQTQADVVVVDPIYLMDFESNTARVAGGDVANTSKKIRRLAGLTDTVIHVITQAEEVRDDTDEDGNRELRAPKRAEIKKTKSVLEDAANTFGIDTLDGQGLIEIGKSRNSSSEGKQVEVLYIPNYGLVRELETGQAAASQFSF